MMLRLPLSALLVAIAALDMANGPTSLALAVTGIVVGVLLALTVLLDALWLGSPRA